MTVPAVPAEVNKPPVVIDPVVADHITLGWLTKAAPNWSKTDETIRKDARFHVVSRLARNRRAADES